ncbi:MAG TPA: stage II sporulation protein P [Bacillota bacterium]|nr:stage II sporulation protein P [Bacillota bacterium]
MKRSIFITLTAALVLFFLIAPSMAFAAQEYFELQRLDERDDGGYFQMKNINDGSVIMRTARLLHPGNEYIDSDNSRYRVIAVEGDIAWAKRLEEGEERPAGSASVRPVGSGNERVQEEGRSKFIGIYHSHGAESYVPSDGTESNEYGGGILRVGSVFEKALDKNGFMAEQVQEPHVPHDAGAYARSRRTAEELTAKNPAALFDVHRDAVPAEEYDEEVQGEDVVKILLVVGGQNPNMASNSQFAEGLKQVADETYPGLVKGILVAQGNYNQDLNPRAVLLEVGAHENRREQAENAVNLFADVVGIYMGQTEAQPREQEQRAGVSRALMLIAAVAIAVFVYLLISAGSWAEFKRKTMQFFTREFGDLRRGLKLGEQEPEEDDRR